MKKKSCAILMILVLLSSLLFAGCGSADKTASSGFSVYYINALGDGITALPYELASDGTDARITEALEALAEDPENVDYRRTLPESVRMEEYALDGGTLSIYFDREYADLEGNSEVLVRAAVVETLVQIDGVDSVIFYVADAPLLDASGMVVGSMSADSFITDYGAETDGLEQTTLTLYFASADGQSLVKKDMDVYYNRSTSRERLIMDYLLKGPETDDAQSALPSGTKVLNVTVTDGVCYVNLDATLLSASSGINANVTLYSMVDSLTELDSINKVQILVDGAQTTNNASLGFSLGTSYERDTTIVNEVGIAIEDPSMAE